MTCAECRDNLLACVEGLLEPELLRQTQAHLQACSECSCDYDATRRLHQQLITRGQATAELSVEVPVMRRVLQTKPEKETIMNRLLRYRWGLGLSVAAGTAAVVLLVVFSSTKAQARAVEVLARGAKAVARLTSLHLKGQLRTLPNDNFSYIDANQDFYPIELWKEYEPELKWRVQKPGRVALMDGTNTLLYVNAANIANRLKGPSSSAFDTDWLHGIANLSHTISNELVLAKRNGWQLELAQATGADGRAKAVVTVHAKSGIPEDDYTKNSFLQNADTRRVYQFDEQTELLERVEIYLVKGGIETQLFTLSQIEYNQPIAADIWQVDIPTNVSLFSEPQVLPDNDHYAAMTPEEAARAFFEACSREDWTEAAKFMSPLTDDLKAYLGGLQIINLGQPFTSKAYDGRFIPYEIKLAPQQFYVRVANTNAAKRYVLTGMYDMHMKLDQDLKWSGEPEVLPDNDAYAKLSPSEAVQAYFQAQDKLDWTEMRKFTSQYDIDKTRKELESAEKAGMDIHKLMPAFEVGEAIQSADQSAYFVKCTMKVVRKHNLALRNDNAVHRWQVDGGL